MVNEFRDAINQGRAPVMSSQEALYDLQVVLAAYQSAEKDAPVSID